MTPKKPGTDEDGAAIRADLDLRMAAAGLRGVLLDPESGSGFQLTGKTDAMVVQTASGCGKDADGEPHRRTHFLHVQEPADGTSDPLCRFLDLAIPEMSVAQCHADIGMAEQPRHHRHRHSVHHRVARKRVTQVVKSAVLDTSFTADPIPEREVVAARAGRVERRRKYEGAPSPAAAVR